MTSRQPSPWVLPAAAAALSAGILAGRAANTLVGALLALVCAMSAAILLKGHKLALLALFCATGCVLGTVAYHPVLPNEGRYAISGVITEDVRVDGPHVRTVLRSVTLDGAAVSSGAYWSFYLDEGEPLPAGIRPGRRVTFTGSVYHPSGADNPGGYDFREYLLQHSVTIGAYGRENLHTVSAPGHFLGQAAALRHHLTEGLIRAMGNKAGPWAATMLLGCRSLTPEEDRNAFARLGIAHILSVSGLHTAILTGLLAAFFRRLHLSRRLRLICTSVLLILYCLITGLNPPVLRATLLMLLREFGALRHRQRTWLPLLSAAWIILLVVNPAQITSASMHLTFGAMLGITQLTPGLIRLHTFRHRGVQKLWQSFCGALGAQLGVLLPELYWFHELPVLGLLLNMIIFALTGMLMLLCWATLFLLPFPPLASLAGKAAALVMNGLVEGVRALDTLAGVTLWTCQANAVTAAGWLLLLICLSPWVSRKHRRLAVLGALVIALSVTPPLHRATAYIQFSVGDGDAALLWDQRTTALIDVGSDGRAATTFLHQHRLSVDMLILTHLHSDHAGGLRALLDSRIPIARCYLADGADTAVDVSPDVLALLEELSTAGTEIVRLGRGDALPLPSGSLTVLWPEHGKVRPNQPANASSLVMLAKLYNTTLFLAGDLDGVYEDYAALPADVLKIAHHGSAGSTSADFLDAVHPQALILSRGDERRRQSIDARRHGISLYDTGADGAVTLIINKNGFTVETLR